MLPVEQSGSNICNLLILGLLAISCLARVVRVQPVYYNYYYPWRYNLSTIRASTNNVYLPPETPMLPEVIDNRARSPVTISNAQLFPNYQYTRKPHEQKGKLIADNNVDLTELSSPNHHVSITEMSCQNNADELYFRATLLSTTRNADRHPTIENAGSSSCKILKSQNEYRVDFGKDEFWNCGVLDCSTDSDRHYCLKIRFPTINGLRLKDDFEVTLQCKAQRNVASQTRRFNLKAIDTTARMVPRVATGGHKSAFETELALYRRAFGSEQDFNSKIDAGGTVILGEELLLRASVRDGDGWKYSKISEVTVHHVESKHQRNRKVTKSLWILDGDGCVNAQLTGISLGEQYRVAPLESYLLFKAFMFDGMQESDEMILSVKITGCLRGEDCVLNCPAGQAMRKARGKREIRVSNDNRTIDWQNDVTFKVASSLSSGNTYYDRTTGLRMVLPYFLAALTVVILIVLLCVIRVFEKRRKRF